MATSGTTNFELDFADIAEEAFERAGKPMRSGYDLRTARRSMNLLMIEWQNRGINMFTIDEGSVTLVAGTATYTLPADTVDLLEHVLRINDGVAATQNDMMLDRMSAIGYANIPNKLLQGRPLQVWIQRLVAAPTITVWPVPDASTAYVLRYWRLRRIQDAGNGPETPDINYRFYPAIVAGLAFYLAQKIPEAAVRLPALEAEYNKQYELAGQEDRERATVRLIPRIFR